MIPIITSGRRTRSKISQGGAPHQRLYGNEPAIHAFAESAQSTTEISSMMSSTMSKEMRSVTDEYIHLPHSKYLRLNDAFSELKCPYLSYNSLTEIVTVVTVPNSIHEVAVYELNSPIIASANAYLSEHAPELRYCIVPLGSTTTTDFEGDYTNSSKQPDGGITYMAIDAGSEVTIAIEAGISQNMWINGHHVNICILVCMNCHDVRAEMATMAQSAAEPVQWYVSQGYYGPNCYRRHKWTGELNEAFIEVWQAGSNPVRYVRKVV
ncbi:hypothetical protein V1520DRAFT_368833 [Lipomyces starkeyi]